jgi:hypothetical protein
MLLQGIFWIDLGTDCPCLLAMRRSVARAIEMGDRISFQFDLTNLFFFKQDYSKCDVFTRKLRNAIS